MNEPDQLATWVRDEQDILWDELRDAIGSAINGAWSIRAGNLALRIIEAARMVGPTRYNAVPWALVAGGVYVAVLDVGGITVELPDQAEQDRLDALMAKYGSRAEHVSRYAASLDAINSDRERAWLGGVHDRDDDEAEGDTDE